MKKMLMAAVMMTTFGVAQAADGTTTSGAVQTSTNNVASGSTSNANNQGVIGAIYNTPADTTAQVTYGGSQTINQNQTVNGATTQTQIVQGGTNSTVHQTFGTQTIRNTPSVSGSPLTSSNDTCMGSASGSANVPGIGLSFGKTYTDDNCVMLKNSRELWNMGMKAASMALMCMDKNNRDALEITGFVCPQSARTQASAKAGEPTDPYIRARMGLPALKE